MGATNPRGQALHRHALFDNGVAALVFGAVCLVLPLFLNGTPALRSVGALLRIPAAVGLGLGVILLVLHVSARRHPRRGMPLLPTGDGLLRPGAIPVGWSVDALERMGAPRFDGLCEQLFAQAGFMTRAQPDVAGGGTDILLYSKHARGVAAMVRCHHEARGALGVEDLCAFYAKMISHEVRRGTYVTSARFTGDAQQFARANGINLLDGERLLALIATRTPQQRDDLLAAGSERV